MVRLIKVHRSFIFNERIERIVIMADREVVGPDALPNYLKYRKLLFTIGRSHGIESHVQRRIGAEDS